MSNNIENGKNFVTECQNHKEEENNMNEIKGIEEFTKNMGNTEPFNYIRESEWIKYLVQTVDDSILKRTIEL